jgi:hypothetical protein
VRCDDASATLAQLVDGAQVGPSPEATHIGRCLRCQAELAQHRKLARAMSLLRSQLTEPGPELLHQILEAVEHAAAAPAGRSGLHRHRAAYVAAATATAATAAGAVLLASRTRRTRLSPTG